MHILPSYLCMYVCYNRIERHVQYNTVISVNSIAQKLFRSLSVCLLLRNNESIKKGELFILISFLSYTLWKGEAKIFFRWLEKFMVCAGETSEQSETFLIYKQNTTKAVNICQSTTVLWENWVSIGFFTLLHSVVVSLLSCTCLKTFLYSFYFFVFFVFFLCGFEMPGEFGILLKKKKWEKKTFLLFRNAFS